ncbi:ferritin-like domain-containing protein [Kitasatospora purpeofusca]|uniref:ferritin-like domain-containing protein n=1 Tax=Kitasatospora purpeofusca TaxID=67352 RepID=UPI0036D2E3CA
MQPPSRRTLLTFGLLLTAGATLTACTGGSGTDPATSAGHRRPDPDEPIRLRAVAATDTLLAGYDALLPQAPQLQSLRAEVAQHRAALQPSTTIPPTTPATTPATTAPTTLPALAALERQTAQSRLADLGAASPQLARLLASVSAAGILHAAALGDPAPTTSPTPTPTASPTPAAGEAATPFQDALSAEHAAIYGYGVVGARLPDDQQRTDARTALAAHQSRRDAWQRLLTGTGATPTAAAAGYQLPFPVADAPAATRLAAHLETRLTTVYADLVASAPAPTRPLAADALRECALRATHWGAAPTPFPGIPNTPTVTPTPDRARGEAARPPDPARATPAHPRPAPLTHLIPP